MNESNLEQNAYLHPSLNIEDELESRGWSEEDLAARMGGDVEANLAMLELYRELGPAEPNLLLGKDTAAKLDAAFGVSEGFFYALHESWLQSVIGGCD